MLSGKLSKSFSLPKKIIRILKALHICTTGAIRADGQLSDEFPISVGVKQRDVLAFMLFNTYLDAVIRVALKNHPDKGIPIEYSHNAPLMPNSRYKLEEAITVQSIAYADDIMITSDNIKDLECLVTSIDDVCIKFGLRINFSKTKYMTILPKNSIPSLNTTLAIRNDINIEHLERMENSRLQKKLMVSKIAEGSRSQSGQKKRWHDLIYTDLKKLNIIDTWKTEARNRNDWRKNIKSLSQKTNKEAERNEQSKKDVKKNIFDVHSKSSSFQCQHPGCNKIAVNKAGLTNHIRQVHKPPSLQHCPNCNNVFKKQGLHNHVKKCSRNQSSVHLLSSV